MRGSSGASWSTRIVVGRGLLARAARDIARRRPGARVAVVSDRTVARLHGSAFLRELRRAGLDARLTSFPPGERSKTRETKARLEDRLAAWGASRDLVVVALGGGVTGDLAGFLAATWHRGVPVVQIPTTLLAMVDAALGGKTAVDLPAGKNLVGAFHPPEALWADVALLRTLPPRAIRCGLAEAVKTALVLDARLFRDLEATADRLRDRDERALRRVVARCLALKGRVVARDPRDLGRRAILNAGHTVAHAVEAASGYRVPHGEAVAIGLALETRLAERLAGFPGASRARLVALLERLGLPVDLPRGLDPERLVAYARRDKKSRRGMIRCALPVGLGRMPPGSDPVVTVPSDRDFLAAIRPN